MTKKNTVTTLVNAIGAPVTNTVANHAENLEKINGHNFKRWQQEMFFYLTTLNLARFLKETIPEVEPPKEGHRAANCKMPKRVTPCQANMVNDNVDMIAMVYDVVAMIFEVNLFTAKAGEDPSYVMSGPEVD
ncbi:hypothetical protein Tco_1027319 [Tanacetum coccineum]